MKKILIFIDSLNILGGAEKVVLDQMKLFENDTNIAFELYGSEKNKIGYIEYFLSIFNLKEFFKLKKYLHKNKYEIFHIHKFHSYLSSSILLALKNKGKIILHVHDFKFYCPKLGVKANGEECKGGIFHYDCNRPIERSFITNLIFDGVKWSKFIINRYFIKKYVDIFICPSRKLQQYIISSLNLPKEKVIYLPNFIDVEENYFPNFSFIQSNRFLFVGRLSHEKGILVALQAFKKIIFENKVSNIYFDIIGEGPEKENLEKFVRENNLEKNISFLGKISNENLQQYYQRSIAIILPSIWLENNPLVAIEAMKYGKPIIGSNIGGIPDLIENEKNGYLFPMGNHKALAEKIELLNNNTNLSIEMGKYGFEKLQKEFNSELFYEKLMENYN